MIRISINLREDERKALAQLADIERRDARQQAALLVRNELERRGLLPVDERPAEKLEVQHAGD